VTIRRTRAVAAALAILCLLWEETPAAEAGGGRIALLVTYKCRPEDRPSFRAHLLGPASEHLGAWRRGGLLADHLLLFNVDVEHEAWDALLVARFDDWAQYERWKENERAFPAALAPAALRMTTAVSSSLSEVAWQGERPPRDPASRSIFFVRPYYFRDKGQYRRFFEAYNQPQLEAWLRNGAVTSYRVLMNQNPSGGTWGVLFIYEYPGWAAAHARDAVKEAVGPELEVLPAWALLGETKGAIRTSGRVTLAERLLPQTTAR
jgi:hypothetical protein